jgi:3-oxocholest-4-en-26-oyl-CoA dehydrogenase beta subunit
MSGHAELRSAIRELLESTCPPELVRKLQDPSTLGHSAELWTQVANAGWLGMALPEECDGGGASLSELGVFFEEAGRVLLPTAFGSTIHAALLVSELGTEEQRARWLPPIARGEIIGAVAHAELDAQSDWRHYATSARPAGVSPDCGILVDGQKAFVRNAGVASLILVVARTSQGDGLCVAAMPSDDVDGVTITAHQTFAHDNQALLDVDDLRIPAGDVLGGPESHSGAEVARRFERVQDTMTALYCAEMAGGASRVLDMTIAYVNERVQFGVPVGTFQAVQHHVANMGTKVEGIRLAAYEALWLIDKAMPAEWAVSIAKSWANESYPFVTQMAHQLHAGMGYVREHSLHLWSQHAKLCALSMGSGARHDDRIAEMLLDES